MDLVPSDELLNAAMNLVTVKVLQVISNENGYPLVAHVKLVSNGREEDVGSILSSSGEAPGNGTIRLQFRKSVREGYAKFHADAIFERDARRPSFSGFFARGVIGGPQGALEGKISSLIVKHNDWNWSDW